jgi:hypothetical protein
MIRDKISSGIKSFGRSTGLTNLYRIFYERPLNTVRKSIREGGPIEQWKTKRGKRAMQKAAASLPPLDPPPKDEGAPLKVHFLTGENHWYQTLFCFVSLQRFSERRIVPVLYSDGSLTKPYRAKFRRIVPWLEVQTKADIERRLDEALPRDQYPLLREWREIQPLTRKITDLHAGETGWKLLLDSDILFFRRPDFLLEWLQNPDRPCFMVDVDTAYGYSPQLRYALARRPIPEAANIGIFGWRSEVLDFAQIQDWLETMVDREDRRYNVTQALCSLMFSGRDCAIAPPEEYIVFPSVEEGKSPSATLHHYVAESKRAYFQYGWKHVARDYREDEKVNT